MNLGLSGLAGRIVSAILYGVIVFVVLFVIGIIVTSFQAEIGAFLKHWAALIGLLAGLVVFFTGARPASV